MFCLSKAGFTLFVLSITQHDLEHIEQSFIIADPDLQPQDRPLTSDVT